jgi:hypothetical protein
MEHAASRAARFRIVANVIARTKRELAIASVDSDRPRTPSPSRAFTRRRWSRAMSLRPLLSLKRRPTRDHALAHQGAAAQAGGCLTAAFRGSGHLVGLRRRCWWGAGTRVRARSHISSPTRFGRSSANVVDSRRCATSSRDPGDRTEDDERRDVGGAPEGCPKGQCGAYSAVPLISQLDD